MAAACPRRVGMTGLLDTNVALYLLGGRMTAPLPTGSYGVSVITEMEPAWPKTSTLRLLTNPISPDFRVSGCMATRRSPLESYIGVSGLPPVSRMSCAIIRCLAPRGGKVARKRLLSRVTVSSAAFSAIISSAAGSAQHSPAHCSLRGRPPDAPLLDSTGRAAASPGKCYRCCS